MRARSLLLSLLFCVTFSYAQKETLPIGPGDLLQVVVLEAPNLDQHARVSDTGDLPLILGGNINLSGMTPFEAAQKIHARLVEGKYLVDPHVAVTVEHSATTNVSVNGQVKAPGSYEIDTPRSMTDVLALAGGMLDTADRAVTIKRRDGLELTEQFESNDGKAALKHDVLINPGDTVYVSRVLQVYLLGNFARPGAYSASPNSSRLTVLQAVAYAGGTPPTAVPSKARGREIC
jgi:polysaccharide export outer membrane protein